MILRGSHFSTTSYNIPFLHDEQGKMHTKYEEDFLSFAPLQISHQAEGI